MIKTIFNKKFLLREFVHGWQHSLLFVLCVMLSIMTMSALNSFKDGVNRSVFRDARQLQGGDIILHSHYPLSPGLTGKVALLKERDQVIVSTMVHEFYSVVRSAGRQSTLLTEIKVVDKYFPLYGKVELGSGGQLRDRLQPGTTIVAEDVLTRLGLEIGDVLLVGSGSLRIVDTAVHESDSPVSVLNFGPRVFVAVADLDVVDLVGKGSRIKYEMLLALPEGSDLQAVAAGLRDKAIAGQERVNTFREEGSGVKRFFDNLLFFLSLIAIFTLLLAGLGMQSCLTALIRQKEETIAVVRSLGAGTAFLYRHYVCLVVGLGLVGALLGLGAGVALAHVLPTLFRGLIPVQGITSVAMVDLGEGLLLGLTVVLLFTVLPLYRLRNIKPVAIFRKEKVARRRDGIFFLTIVFAAVVIVVLISAQLEDTRLGLLFTAAVLAFIAAISLAANLLVKMALPLNLKTLSLRQALRSMTRTGNASRSVIITLASALSLLFVIYLMKHTLHDTYIESYPANAPNLFSLDIQPDQRQGFVEFFEQRPQLFPIIRARLQAINGEGISRVEELRKKRDNFAREFNLTYRDDLLEDEQLLEGKSLFGGAGSNDMLEVSVLDTVTQMGNIDMGDVL
ncbi:MAG TPA: FtsX-like permease family protein, partial [Desulfopila sp.]|nr:FtsX-like permease family protein [Desulfopila sp.]